MAHDNELGTFNFGDFQEEATGVPQTGQLHVMFVPAVDAVEDRIVSAQAADLIASAGLHCLVANPVPLELWMHELVRYPQLPVNPIAWDTTDCTTILARLFALYGTPSNHIAIRDDVNEVAACMLRKLQHGAPPPTDTAARTEVLHQLVNGHVTGKVTFAASLSHTVLIPRLVASKSG